MGCKNSTIASQATDTRRLCPWENSNQKVSELALHGCWSMAHTNVCTYE